VICGQASVNHILHIIRGQQILIVSVLVDHIVDEVADLHVFLFSLAWCFKYGIYKTYLLLRSISQFACNGTQTRNCVNDLNILILSLENSEYNISVGNFEIL